MITVDGSAIPTPSDYQVGVMDLSKAERNAKGEIIIERIATKRKIEVSWKYLSQGDLANLLSKVSTNIFFTVEYPDPLTGALRTGTFYVGDRNTSMLDFKNGVPRWKEIKFNFVER